MSDNNFLDNDMSMHNQALSHYVCGENSQNGLANDTGADCETESEQEEIDQ